MDSGRPRPDEQTASFVASIHRFIKGRFIRTKSVLNADYQTVRVNDVAEARSLEEVTAGRKLIL